MNNLHEMIDVFLSEHRDGDSDFAPVTRTDLMQLDNIILELAQLKFEADCDGDLPIKWNIINRHTHTPLIHQSIPRDDNIRRLSSLTSLIGWASDQLNHLASNMREKE